MNFSFFAGSPLFRELAEAELGTFYLTDFLAKHFDALVWQGLRLDRHPELLPAYFGNYTTLLLLSQTERDDVVAAGRAIGPSRSTSASGRRSDETVAHRGGPFPKPFAPMRQSARRG